MLVERSEWMTYVTHLLADIGKPQDGSANFNGNDVNGPSQNVIYFKLCSHQRTYDKTTSVYWITEIIG